MDRRAFMQQLGVTASLVAGLPRLGQAMPIGARRLKRIGIQLYTLRDAARVNLERTLADIAAAGYKDVELLASMNNFGMPAAKLRATLDRLGLRAPSTHVGTLADIDRQVDEAKILGHEYIILASVPADRRKSLDDYRYWADELNKAGHIARARGVWIGFHDEPEHFLPLPGGVGYDALADRIDPSVVRLQLDTGNAAMGGRDPMQLLERFRDRYWLFHVKDVAALGAKTDTELGKGTIDLRRLLKAIPRIDEKILYVEQESYPGAPLASARRDHDYLASLDF